MNRSTYSQRYSRSDPETARNGAAAVEMAVVAPILFAVVLAIFEFGRAFMVGQIVTDAAREGARQAAVGSSNTEVTQMVQQLLHDSVGVATQDVTVTLTVDNSQAANEVAQAEPGDTCTVLVEVPFNKVQFVAGNYLTTQPITGQVTMRRE